MRSTLKKGTNEPVARQVALQNVKIVSVSFIYIVFFRIRTVDESV